MGSAGVVPRLTATDTSPGTLVYSLSGVDGGKFTIDDRGQMWTKAEETYEWSLPQAKRNRVTVTNSATGVSAKGDCVILSKRESHDNAGTIARDGSCTVTLLTKKTYFNDEEIVRAFR